MEIRIFRGCNPDMLAAEVNKTIHDLKNHTIEVISTTTVAVGNVNMGLRAETTIILQIKRNHH